MSIKEIADMTVQAVKTYVDKKIDEVFDMVKTLPVPEKGEKGDQGDPPDHELLSSLIKQAIPDLDPIIETAVKKQVDSLVIPAPLNGKDGQDGRDGKDGRDGRDGKDALSLQIEATIDPEWNYKRGTYARYKGGLWFAFTDTDGMKGWDCIVRGLDSFDFDYDGARGVTMTAIDSTGAKVEKRFSVPMMIYRGTYEYGKSYEQGDTTTWNGSTWTCLRDTDQAPNTGSEDWQLSVKAGRNASQQVKVKHG